MPEQETVSFLVSWFDDVSSREREFILIFWIRESNVEMMETKNKKIFLRKIKTQEIKEEDLFVGNTVTVLSRKLKIFDYGDEETKLRVGTVQQSTLALIKPSSVREVGKILKEIYNNGLTIGKAKLTQLTGVAAECLYEEYRSSDIFQDLVNSVTGGPSLVLVLVGENAVEKWNSGLGNVDPQLDRDNNSNSIRARFGSNEIENVGYSSSSAAQAQQDINLFFPDKPNPNPGLRLATSAEFNDTTCCIIMPHAVKDRRVGEIVDAIQEAGFRISGFQSFNLHFGKAEEFLEIYKNVVDYYGDMVKELCSGMCIALEIGIETDNQITNGSTVETFREFTGPRDPDIARKLRPGSLRARFGLNCVQNGVHCTDLPEDGPLEIQYFFKVLQ